MATYIKCCEEGCEEDGEPCCECVCNKPDGEGTVYLRWYDDNTCLPLSSGSCTEGGDDFALPWDAELCRYYFVNAYGEFFQLNFSESENQWVIISNYEPYLDCPGPPQPNDCCGGVYMVTDWYGGHDCDAFNASPGTFNNPTNSDLVFECSGVGIGFFATKTSPF